MDRNCDQQTSTTIIVVDDIVALYSSVLTTVADGHKFSAVMRLSRRLLDRAKNAILRTLPAFATHGVIPSEFCTNILRHKIGFFRNVPIMFRLFS